ncbi:hypothetical protein MN608_03026 [Microdochium nivale]|nr:hypothetical protein MN608_03026 [Microdochium nivale]
MTRANPRGGCKEASTNLAPADFALHYDLARHSRDSLYARYSTSGVPPLSSDQLRSGILAAHTLLASGSSKQVRVSCHQICTATEAVVGRSSRSRLVKLTCSTGLIPSSQALESRDGVSIFYPGPPWFKCSAASSKVGIGCVAMRAHSRWPG